MTTSISGTGGVTFNDNSVQNTAATGFGFKNRLINSAMQIDQRNAGASQTVTTSGAYTVDRFFVQPTGASVTTQRVAGPSGYQYALRLTGAASVTQCFVQQKIEQLNSNDLAGQTITVSFTASSSTLTSLTCYVEYASAADNWTTFTTQTTQAITINSTATRYSFQSTLSASATNGIRFIFGTGAFTSGTLDITGMQLEKGSTATSFDVRDYGRELMLCQRYYWKYTGSICVMANWDGYTHFGTIFLKEVMRTSPTLAYSALADFDVLQGTTSYTPNLGLSITTGGTSTIEFDAATASPQTTGGCAFVRTSGWLAFLSEL